MTTQTYWLLKSEPETFSLNDLKKSSTTAWDGVRNYTARNNLNSMKKGDLAFFYHSGKEPSIVGIVKVIKESYPDKTDSTNKFVCVDVQFVEELKKPILLALLKTKKELADFILFKQGRLSVVPVTKQQWNFILKL